MKNQHKLLIEQIPLKFSHKSPKELNKEIQSFIINNNIKGRKQLMHSSDSENDWGTGQMYKTAGPHGLNILHKLFPKKTQEEKLKEIKNFIKKNNIKNRNQLKYSSDIDNDWGVGGMHVFLKDLNFLDSFFPEKSNEQKIKEITNFVKKNKIKNYNQLIHTSDRDNGWGHGGMASTAKELNILDNLFPEKSDEQKIKEITNFVFKNKIQSRTELKFSSNPENGWGPMAMYKESLPSKLNILDDLFGFEKKESIGEKKVYESLLKLGYEVIKGRNGLRPGVAVRQYTFNDCHSPKGTNFCNRLKMDFYLITGENEKIVIEFNGEQHYKSVKRWGGDEGLEYRQECDRIKEEYCKNNKIRLIVIPYWDLNTIDEIVTSEIKPYKKMKKNIKSKTVKLTESDLSRIVKRVIKESKISNTVLRRLHNPETKKFIEKCAMSDIKYANEHNRSPMYVYNLLHEILNNEKLGTQFLVPTDTNPNGDLEFDFGGNTEDEVLHFLEETYGDMILNIYKKYKKK